MKWTPAKLLLATLALAVIATPVYAQDAFQNFYSQFQSGSGEQAPVSDEFLPLTGGTVNGRVNIDNSLFIQADEPTANGRLFFERELAGGRDRRSPGDPADNNTHRWVFLHRQSESSSGDYAREGDLELWEYELDTADRTCDSRYAVSATTEERLLDLNGDIIEIPEGQTAYDYIFSLRDAAADGSPERAHYQSLLQQNPALLGDGSGYCNSRLLAFEKGTRDALFSGRLGIDTGFPQFTLDVGGDINFDGSLYQNGAEFVSSPWTANGSNLEYEDGNIVGASRFEVDVNAGSVLDDDPTNDPYSRVNADSFHTNGLGEGQIYIEGASIDSNTTMQIAKGRAGGQSAENVEFGGNVTANAFYYSSDRNLKNDIKTLNYGLTDVQALEGVTYKWKDAKNQDLQIGFIAQDVEKVIPELVTEDADGMKSVDYARVVPVLVEAIKQQQIQINELKAQINETEK